MNNTLKEKIKNEEEFIALLLKHKDLVSEWLESGIEVDFFEEQHRLLLQAIHYAYSEDVLLTRKTFVSWLNQNAPSRSEIPTFETVFVNINFLQPKKDDFPLLKKQIINQHVMINSVNAVERFRNAMKNGEEPVFIAKKLASEMQNVVTDNVDVRPTIYESIQVYAPNYLKELKEKKEKGLDLDVIKCGIKEIDETMVIGHAPGELTLYGADVGNYKTTMMLNVSTNIWDLSKKNVLFVPLEMQRNRFYQKLLSRVAKVPFDRIEHPSILTEDEWKAIEKATEFINLKSDSHFYIMEKADRTNVSAIRREIEKHIEIFKPHVVVIDYVGILMPDKGQLTDRNDLQIGHMLKDLRQMGKAGVMHKEGFHIISGVQIGREALKRVRRLGVDKIGFNSEDLRGSHEYSADATTIYAQMKDPAQPNSRLNFFVVKSRFGKTVFPNGETRATLSVNPGISLIESVDDGWLPRKRPDILAKVDDAKLDEDFDLGDIEGIEEDKPADPKKHPKSIKAPKVEIEDEFSDLNDFGIDGIV